MYEGEAHAPFKFIQPSIFYWPNETIRLPQVSKSATPNKVNLFSSDDTGELIRKATIDLGEIDKKLTEVDDHSPKSHFHTTTATSISIGSMLAVLLMAALFKTLWRRCSIKRTKRIARGEIQDDIEFCHKPSNPQQQKRPTERPPAPPVPTKPPSPIPIKLSLKRLQHAISLGNIEVSGKANSIHNTSRCYDSEDENMGRKKPRPQTTGLYPRTSVYSKGDIREQYCLTDRQLSSIERPRRERFFGCWSGRGAPQSILGVCVGRRAPSDENIADYAPFYKYPRYHPHDLLQHEEDLESSYFRRRPTSILSTGSASSDVKRYTWMPADEESVRLEGPRPICSDYDDFTRGPYVVGTYPPKPYLSQSTEHIAGLYRCPAHIGLPPPPPPPVVPMEIATPRTKHVSFARSHTLTSFDEASMGLRSSGRMSNARSQERLIGGKKPILTTVPLQQHMQHQQQTQSQMAQMSQQQPPQQQHVAIGPCGPMQSIPVQQILQSVPFRHHHAAQQQVTIQHKPTQMQQSAPPQANMLLISQQQLQLPPPPPPEVVVVEKIKRSAMKTQATQTEVYLARKGVAPHHLSLSPRTIHRVKMVSQGAQTNGTNGRKLTKSLSEMTGGRPQPLESSLVPDEPNSPPEHEPLHRTQSEEPPRSPLMVPTTPHLHRHFELPPPQPPQISQSRTSSRTSEPLLSYSDQPTGHSRNLSQDSAVSYRSVDTACMTASSSNLGVPSFSTIATTASNTKTSQELSINFSQESIISRARSLSRTSSGRGTPRTGIDGSPHNFDYESNSLPRRTCPHYRVEEYCTHSLPRREHHHHHDSCRHITECNELLNGTTIQFRKEKVSRESSTDSSQQWDRRRLSVGVEVTPKTHATLRRQSMPLQCHQIQSINRQTPSEDLCSTCESESDSKPDSNERVESDREQDDEEQEIFIDFKPHISPTPSPRARRKKLQKTLSDGEILIEKKSDIRESILVASASEEDLKQAESLRMQEYQYQNLPIKDEGICDKQNLLTLPSEAEGNLRMKREAFRKRSISLEDPTADEEARLAKSAPPSPCQEEPSGHVRSAYPSTDSLANDLTRDHSDGIWNESQATVLHAEGRDTEQNSQLLTPSSKRKNLILQHQQRSSVDTDALELEEQFSDQSVPYTPLSTLKPAATQTMPQQHIHKQQVETTVAIAPCITTPSIAVTPSLSIDAEDGDVQTKTGSNSRRPSRTLSPSLQDRKKIEPLVHAQSPSRPMDMETPSSPAEHFLSRTEPVVKNNTDISECSTNTEDYVTCTDNSKRAPGMKTPTTASSSSTQVPVSAQSSQTATHDGSSFESASSLYSTRGDTICEEAPLVEEVAASSEATPTPAHSKTSPSHSVSSSSSGSYNLTNLARSKAAPKVSTVGSNAVVTKTSAPSKKKPESVSDDERSEKRYSSSGYYESPQDEDHRSTKHRRSRDWNEEERRRRKNNMKLDIERENLRALTSPIKKPSPGFKQVSPDDRTALNVLDGTSPNKSKRFRPKPRRPPRNRSTSGEDSLPRKIKTPIKSPDRPIVTIPPATKTSPSKFQKPHVSPKKQKIELTSEKRLKAKSIESLRSVSPGSDSVFYSEADVIPDQQVHCHHCGKEVEVVTAVSGSQESIGTMDEDGPDIVKPPADFADSPVATKSSQRLYKKMDKRFRSEERNVDRRHHRARQENARAKSEERNKEQSSQSPPSLRPAGSSPCVMPEGTFNTRDQPADPEQGIYHGNYRLGIWICITDRDVWRRNDLQQLDRPRELGERRSSTDSEKDFRKKYQAITHRLVHRRSCVEMYRRQTSNSFELLSPPLPPPNDAAATLRTQLEEILRLMLVVWAREGQANRVVSGESSASDKTIVVRRESGEFGFRIHGSKPVVVSAIEPDTPAESCGLEVGDIVLSVNGIPVIDKSHSEVVKIAHAGSDTLELEVARTIGLLASDPQESTSPALYSGYLWRQGGQVSGGTGSGKWFRRWFCLRPDHCLYYYKAEGDTQPIGAVLLTNHSVEHCSSDVGRQHAFRVTSTESMPLHLAADTEEAANRWVAIMSHAATQSDPWLETSTRNLRLPPGSVPRPDCFGYLMKLGSRWRGWSKRYCVLKDACLYFYQDGNSKNAFGMACLQGYRVQPTSTAGGKKHAFEIAPPEPKLRHYYFSTESEMDKKRWVAALEYSIDRWMKAG